MLMAPASTVDTYSVCFPKCLKRCLLQIEFGPSDSPPNKPDGLPERENQRTIFYSFNFARNPAPAH